MGAREITIAYGQTEASPLITMTRTDDPIEKRVGTVGRPFPGIEVKIVDPLSGEELPDGRSGELCCRGHDVMLGYYNMPEATAQAIDADGWLHTGDLALRQPDGYFRITGRIKEMIIRGGENIAPREIEELLYQHPQGGAGVGRRRARSEVRRRDPGLDQAARGRVGHGGGDPRLLPRAPGALQDARATSSSSTAFPRRSPARSRSTRSASRPSRTWGCTRRRPSKRREGNRHDRPILTALSTRWQLGKLRAA